MAKKRSAAENGNTKPSTGKKALKKSSRKAKAAVKPNVPPHKCTGAVPSVARRANEVIAIYPITPASGMGEMADR